MINERPYANEPPSKLLGQKHIRFRIYDKCACYPPIPPPVGCEVSEKLER